MPEENSMDKAVPNRRSQHQEEPPYRCVDARLTGVLCQCGVRLRSLNGLQPFGIRRTRTGHLWRHQIPVTKPESGNNAPEQPHFHDGHT